MSKGPYSHSSLPLSLAPPTLTRPSHSHSSLPLSLVPPTTFTITLTLSALVARHSLRMRGTSAFFMAVKSTRLAMDGMMPSAMSCIWGESASRARYSIGRTWWRMSAGGARDNSNGMCCMSSSVICRNRWGEWSDILRWVPSNLRWFLRIYGDLRGFINKCSRQNILYQLRLLQ